LPKEHELTETVADFKTKFPNSEIHSIISHDCKKSIPIINKDGLIDLPHFLSNDYNIILKITEHCENYLTLLRYLDLNEVTRFVIFVNNRGFISERTKIENYFETLDDINMKNIKIYYLKCLKSIQHNKWEIIYNHFTCSRVPKLIENNSVDVKGNKLTLKLNSFGPGSIQTSSKNLSNNSDLAGKPLKRSLTVNDIVDKNNLVKSTINGTSAIYVTTKDAYSLTDGPTIFICDDIEKIAKFCIQQANIPSLVMDDLLKKIEYNNVLNKKISEFEKDLDYLKEHDDASVLFNSPIYVYEME
jgi:hypothetical protein